MGPDSASGSRSWGGRQFGRWGGVAVESEGLAARVEFASLFAAGSHRAEVIATFLALLELIRLRVVRARQTERFGTIALELAVDTIEEAALRVRDLGEPEEWRGGEEEEHGDATVRDP